MTRSAILFLTLCLMLTSTAAFATDGVIEINQARALAGGVVPGDIAGFPVTISQSGSYRLTSNLTIASQATTAIIVTASDVTIDLNGFAITGPNVCTAGSPTTCALAGGGSGINAPAAERVTVRNGTIAGMGHDGIFLNAFSRIENVRVSQNGSVGISVGQSSVIIGCIGDINLAAGITAPNGNCVIQNCTALSNGTFGISALVGGNVVTGCVSRSNQLGILAAADSLVTGSAATGNAGFGLSLTSSTAYSNCLIAGNNGANPDVSSGLQIGTNICNGAACP